MTLKSLQWNNDFEKFPVGGWVVGVSVIITSALVLLRQELEGGEGGGVWSGPLRQELRPV